MDSPQQQFCLKWNSFGSNLATAFGNLFKSESLTDVTLFCEGVQLKAHKVILAACSKHFQDMFELAPPCPGTLVILDGTSASNMAALLEFMYKGEVHVSQDCLSSFLKAAECLQVKGLSIEHEKLAGGSDAQSQQLSPGACSSFHHHLQDGRSSPSSLGSEAHSPPRKQPKLNHTTSSSIPSPLSTDPTDLTSPTTPTTSAGSPFPPSSVIAPYLPQYHRVYERSNSTSAVVAMPPSAAFDRKRTHGGGRRSLTEADTNCSASLSSITTGGTSTGGSNCLQDNNSSSAARPSVLRDGKGRSTTLSPADLTASYRSPTMSDGGGQQNDAASRFNSDSTAETGERERAVHASCGGTNSSGGGGATNCANNVNNNGTAFDRPPLLVGSGNGDCGGTSSDLVNCKGDSPRPSQQQGQSQQSQCSNFDGIAENTVCRRRGRPPSTSLIPTDLRIKQEPLHATGLRGDELSAASYKELKQQVAAAAAAASGGANDKEMSSLWNAKSIVHKSSSVATPDGKKLKCPFCERLYGYETNLRAHIRQRHQGIRVPCPFCSRTFTRNNTVRRHIAREHKAELNMKTAAAAQASAVAAAAAAAASTCYPLPNHSQ